MHAKALFPNYQLILDLEYKAFSYQELMKAEQKRPRYLSIKSRVRFEINKNALHNLVHSGEGELATKDALYIAKHLLLRTPVDKSNYCLQTLLTKLRMVHTAPSEVCICFGNNWAKSLVPADVIGVPSFVETLEYFGIEYYSRRFFLVNNSEPYFDTVRLSSVFDPPINFEIYQAVLAKVFSTGRDLEPGQRSFDHGFKNR